MGVSGSDQAGAVAGQVEMGEQAAGEEVRVEVCQEAVDASKDLARGGVSGGVGVDDSADLSHEGRGLDVMALDVADGDGGTCGTAADDVVEVAADVRAVAGGQVANGDVKAGDSGQFLRKQTGLQRTGELVLGVVEAGAVQGLCDESGQRGEDRTFSQRERTRAVVGQDQQPDGPAGGNQGEESPGVPVAVAGSIGVGALEIGEAGEEARSRRGQGPRGRGTRRHRLTIEASHELGTVPTVSNDVQTAVLGRHQGQPRASKAGTSWSATWSTTSWTPMASVKDAARCIRW